MKPSTTNIIATVILTGVIVGGGVYAYQQKQAQNTQKSLNGQITTLQSQKATLERQVSTLRSSNAIDTSDWKVYNDDRYHFSIKYPRKTKEFDEEWTAGPDSAGGAYFGVPGLGDTVWGIDVYDANQTSLDTLIEDQGRHLDGRMEQREEITIDGQKAYLVTVAGDDATSTYIYKVVYIIRSGKILAFSNGAVDRPEFDASYNTLRFTQ